MSKINQAGLDLIKAWEGLRLDAYRDGGGVLTIGYGHTKNVKAGDRITEGTAEKYLREDLGWAEDAVNSFVSAPLTSNQFSALVSLVFNVGAYAFAKSTLLRKLNAKDYSGSAKKSVRWSYDNGKFIQGLKNRRMAELKLFLED